MGAAKITNEQLNGKLDSIVKSGDDRHSDNVRRLDEIRNDVIEVKGDVKAANSRLSKAEGTIAAHTWAIYVIGAAALALFSAVLAKLFR